MFSKSDQEKTSIGLGFLQYIVVAFLVFSWSLLADPGTDGPAEGHSPGEDPHKIVTAEACGECHVSEYEVWKRTPHATTFKTLHRLKAAEKIAEKMNFHLIKRESLCLDCHYTPVIKNDTTRAVSGVSCESCHGAGKDYIDIHNQYGGNGLDHDTETPDHKLQRIQQSIAAGMRRPSDLYPVAARCFQCHTVPHEALVNTGGHTTGSANFEFMSWSQEQTRHNFLDSLIKGDGTVNAERPVARKRVMYILGRMLDLEYSLRGEASATASKRYEKAMSRRVRNGVVELREIAARSKLSEVEAILATVRGVKVIPNNRQPLLAAADAIAEQAKLFLDRHDGTGLASIDPVMSGDYEPMAKPLVPKKPPPQPVASADNPDTETVSTADGNLSSEPKIIPGRPAVGAVKTRLRAAPKHGVIGSSKCGNCHDQQTEWWFEDRHFASADRFFESSPKALAIASFYGLSQSELLMGNRICADCHGTVLTGRENREIRDGVGCESCHGPAEDYLEPHKEGEKQQGANRPGYVKALTSGMNPLRNAEVRAQMCSDCHYITDERLLSSGHPSGQDFDYGKGMAAIKHWEGDGLPETELQGAMAARLKSRGPVPEVAKARAERVIPGRGVPASESRATATPPSSQALRTTKKSWNPPKARPVAKKDSQNQPSRVTLRKPFPEIEPDTPVEDVLLILKKRLEMLYRAVQSAEGKSP